MRAALLTVAAIVLAGCTSGGSGGIHEAPETGAWSFDTGTLPENTTLRGYEIEERFTFEVQVSPVEEVIDGWGRGLRGYDVTYPITVLERDGDGFKAVRQNASFLMRASDGQGFAIQYDGGVIFDRDGFEWRPFLYTIAKLWGEAGRPTNADTERDEALDFGEVNVKFTIIDTWRPYEGVRPYACHGTTLALESRLADPEALKRDIEAATGAEVTVHQSEPDPHALPSRITCFDGEAAAAWSWTYSGDRAGAQVRGDSVPEFPVDRSAVPSRPDHAIPWTPVKGLTGETVYVPGQGDDAWAGWLHDMARTWHLAEDEPQTVWVTGAIPFDAAAQVTAVEEGRRTWAWFDEVLEDIYIRDMTFRTDYEVEVPETIADPAAVRAALTHWQLPQAEKPMLERSVHGMTWSVGEPCGGRMAYVDAVDGHLDRIETHSSLCQGSTAQRAPIPAEPSSMRAADRAPLRDVQVNVLRHDLLLHRALLLADDPSDHRSGAVVPAKGVWLADAIIDAVRS